MLATTSELAKGKDRSDWDPIENWAGCDFGFAKATEGTGFQAKSFAGNWANLAEAGIPRGAYHFYHPGLDPIGQAKFFLGTVKAAGIKPGDMLSADVEILAGEILASPGRVNTVISNADVAVTATGVDAGVKAFLDELTFGLIALGLYKREGLRRRKVPVNPLIVYTNHAVGQYLTETARAYPNLWFAWPVSNPPSPTLMAPWPAYRFWQNSWTPDDADVYNGTVATLKLWIASYLPMRHRSIKTFYSGGMPSLAKVCSEHGDSITRVIARTLRHTPQPKFIKYVAKGNFRAPMPKGVKIWIAVG